MPREDSLAVKEAFGWVRRYLRALNGRSTSDEILTLVEETAAELFPKTPYFATAVRCPDGIWLCHSPGRGTPRGLRTFKRHRAALSLIAGHDHSFADAFVRFPKASAPGDTLTVEDYDKALLARKLKHDYAEVEDIHELVLTPVIRSRSGVVAHLVLSDFRKNYGSEIERVFAATLADFASIALSS